MPTQVLRAVLCSLPLLLTLLLLGGPSIARAQVVGFPHGSCSNTACDLSPYDLRWSNSQDLPGASVICFTVLPKACRANSQYLCCERFTLELNKIVVTADPVCINTIDRVSAQNPASPQVAFSFDVYGPYWAELTLQSLGLNQNLAVGQQYCIHFKLGSICNSITNFCVGEDGGCRWAKAQSR